MGTRKQIYLGEADQRLLAEESRRTGPSASELIRRAIQQCYGGGRKLTWDEVFAHPVRVGSGGEDSLVYDRLFDDEWIDEILDQATKDDR